MGISLVTKYVSFSMLPAHYVFAHRLGIVASDSFVVYAILNSSCHEPWARTYSSTLETRINYSPSDCFESFAFPLLDREAKVILKRVGSEYHQKLQETYGAKNIGLTDTNNLLHNPSEHSEEIACLRKLSVQMDEAVRDAYGWQDLALDHGFYLDDQPFREELLEGLQGRDRKKKLSEVRYTISPQARKEVLKRLLKLNHERHAEEVAKGWWKQDSKGKWKVTEKGKNWLKKTRKAERKARAKESGKQGSEQEQVFKVETPLFGTDY